MRNPVFAAFALLALSIGAAGAAEVARQGSLAIESPWARASLVKSRPAAAYFTVRNKGAEADRLLELKSPVAANAEIHAVKNEGGVMQMSPAGPVDIPAGSEISLAPGGMHIMLTGLKESLVKGQTTELTLVFEKAGEVTIVMPILGPGATGPE